MDQISGTKQERHFFQRDPGGCDTCFSFGSLVANGGKGGQCGV